MKTFFTSKYFFIFLLIEAVIFSGAWYFYLVYEQKYTDEVIGKIDTAFHTTINGYAMVSQVLFDEVINKPDIINIFKQAHTATTEQQISIRQQLFEALNSVYQRLKQKNLRQLHFHLPDNTSFLRFHKPQKFGDNLSKIRYSVMNTNKYKIPSQGFEEGRIFNGFRYVFPLFDGEQHIGSVETSVSFDAIRQEIQKIYGLEYNIMLRREVVEQKLFASQLGHYDTCALDEHFLCENLQTKNSALLLEQIEQKMRESVHLKLETGKPFVEHVQIRNDFYDVAFYPINNIENQQVAYIITYNPSHRLYELQMQFILFISITGVDSF